MFDKLVNNEKIKVTRSEAKLHALNKCEKRLTNVSHTHIG